MFVTYVLSKIRAHQRYRRITRELMQLTDRELEDIGISRYEIGVVASRQNAVS